MTIVLLTSALVQAMAARRSRELSPERATSDDPGRRLPPPRRTSRPASSWRCSTARASPSFRITGQPAGDSADVGEPARRGPHRGARAQLPTRRGASSRATARTSARAWCGCADEFDEIEARIGYRFRDRGLLEHALTHKSRAAEDVSGGVADNESLEFLGDAVLGLVVADALFHQYPDLRRGAEVEDQGRGRLDAVAGAARRGRSASATT